MSLTYVIFVNQRKTQGVSNFTFIREKLNDQGSISKLQLHTDKYFCRLTISYESSVLLAYANGSTDAISLCIFLLITFLYGAMLQRHSAYLQVVAEVD